MRFLGKSKAIIASVLTLVMVFSLVVPARAAEVDNPYNLKILEDSDIQRVVETSYGTNIYVATYDKENDTMQMSITNVETSDTKVSSKFVVGDLGSEPERSVRAASSGEKTFSNYEYRMVFGDPTVWTLRRPDGYVNMKYFRIKETKANRAQLIVFRDLVDDINSIEAAIGGTAILSVIASASLGASGIFEVASAGALTPAMYASATAAATALGISMMTIQKWDTLCQKAYQQYNFILNAYPTM